MKRIIIAIALLGIIVISGTIGFMLIQKWSFFDSLYMTIITIGTVGFREVRELTSMGRIFTIGLIVVGISVAGYAVATLSAFIIEGEIKNLFKGRKMNKQITKLNNHIIVCGYGKTGGEIVNELKKSNKHFVVIETDEHKAEELKNQGYLVLVGNATEDEILEQAGVNQAEVLVATLSNDADNVYVVLTARGMNPDIRIIARAVDEISSKKLIRAGADKVVSPYSIAGKRMARLISSPGIVDFLEVMVMSQELELMIEEVTIQQGSPLIKKLLHESNIRAETDGAYVIGIKKGDEKIVVNPPGDTRLDEGHILYVLGNNAQIEKLQELAK